MEFRDFRMSLAVRGGLLYNERVARKMHLHIAGTDPAGESSCKNPGYRRGEKRWDNRVKRIKRKRGSVRFI